MSRKIREIIGYLTAEDLNIARMIWARLEALKSNPGAFSAQESVQVYLDYFRLMGDLVARYNVDDEQEWGLSAYTGAIYYTEDD